MRSIRYSTDFGGLIKLLFTIHSCIHSRENMRNNLVLILSVTLNKQIVYNFKIKYE